MRIEVERKPANTETAATFRPKKYEGRIRLYRFNDFVSLKISFVTPAPGGESYFSSHVRPDRFEELARVMMEVHPEAAIRAFGAAIKDFSAEKPHEEADAA